MLENTSIISEFYFEILEISEDIIFIKSKKHKSFLEVNQ